MVRNIEVKYIESEDDGIVDVIVKKYHSQLTQPISESEKSTMAIGDDNTYNIK